MNRVKTADLLIHSKWLDEQTRFVLACQYWSSWNVVTFFNKLHISARKQILYKYATAKSKFYDHESNVARWTRNYIAGHVSGSPSWGLPYGYYHWNYVSLQSCLLDDLTEEKREALLYRYFEHAYWTPICRFCLSKMNVDHQEDLLKRFPLKVLRTYLYWPRQRFFLNAVNKVWNCLPGRDFYF
ncbi:uncharacterized protein TNIN_34471, partial [Trichonephila inaurata madagascariensis]